ncbi:MAG: PorP/SprF family type IX secretion system membrane protein [Bacteroidales bacterium]|nr:PorP/SprF family type IX secretion system membrane protein [Bacteroidales bacterium]
MLKRSAILLIITVATALIAGGQGFKSGPVYQMLLMNNPAISGSEGDGVLRLSYNNYYPGNSYDLHSVYLSYDSYFPGLHGGTAFYLSEDYLGGIINDLRGGISYAYFLQAGSDLFINAGLTASVFHRGYNFGNAILPDQIDPVGGVSFPTSEVPGINGKTVFDVGAGFLFITGKLTGGFSVNHLAEPELSSSAVSSERIRRKYSMNLSADLNLSSSGSLKIEPLLLVIQQGDYFSAGAGASIESSHLAINTIFSGDNGSNLNMQTGFAFTVNVMSVYYNYQFNVSSGNIFLPLSLLHQVGLAFSLNNVEKRKAFKTINFPKM